MEGTKKVSEEGQSSKTISELNSYCVRVRTCIYKLLALLLLQDVHESVQQYTCGNFILILPYSAVNHFYTI